MPYFVFRIREPRILELVESFDGYRDARALVRALRAESTREDPFTARLVRATDEAHARRLLSERRDPRPLGEDA